MHFNIFLVQGAVLYAYYGTENDFRLLRDKNIDLNGRVMLVRAGRISFAEKVCGFSKNDITLIFKFSSFPNHSKV